jgi:tRNA modification GTPase
MIELELDFGEEDVEFADRQDLKDLILKIQQLLKKLLDSFQLGNAIKHGVNTVIAGRPNAGKSTLLNALLNEERAIVSDIAGTTRDTIEEILNIKGVQFRIIDTAGIREATDQIEAIGVEKTLQQVAKSAILVYVYDRTQLTPKEVLSDITTLQKEGLKTLVISNKADQASLGEATDPNWVLLQEQYDCITLSAKEKTNIDTLQEALFELVAAGNIDSASTIVSNSRHYEALQNALQSMDAVLDGLNMGITGDFLAMDIRHCLNHLGEITGNISSDDLLGSIFSRFCIGK